MRMTPVFAVTLLAVLGTFTASAAHAEGGIRVQHSDHQFNIVQDLEQAEDQTRVGKAQGGALEGEADDGSASAGSAPKAGAPLPRCGYPGRACLLTYECALPPNCDPSLPRR